MKILKFIKNGLLTWLGTNAIAAIIYLLAAALGIEFQPFLCSQCMTTLQFVLVFGVVFSAPGSAFVVAILYIIEMFHDADQKLYVAVASMLITCAVVITAFVSLFGTDGFGYLTVIIFLLPYAFASQVSFLFFARKFIFDTNTSITITTKGSEA